MAQDAGSSSWYATDEIFLMILKGPWRFGANLEVWYGSFRLFASSHT
jgi:hypothetical protein